MYVEERGRGPAVLLLHGSPSTREAFYPLAQALEGSCRVLIPDFPGYGQTPRLPLPASIAMGNELLEGELLRRGIKEVTVVGFSLGGYRALLLALSGRVKVTRLLLLAGLAGFDEAERAGFHGFAGAVAAGAELHQVWIDRALAPAFAASHPKARAAVSAWLDAPIREAFVEELEASAKMEDLTPRLSSLHVPVIARVGALDLATPRTKSQAIVDAIAGARLEIVPDCGHALIVEDPEGTAEATRRLLGAGWP